MAALEDLRQSATIQGVVPGGFVTVTTTLNYTGTVVQQTPMAGQPLPKHTDTFRLSHLYENGQESANEGVCHGAPGV
mgnify:CR=1 FL=1